MKLKSLFLVLSLCLILNQTFSQKISTASQANLENENGHQQKFPSNSQSESKSDSEEIKLKEKFNSFKQKHSKNYTKEEEFQKFVNFKLNMEHAAELTKKALSLNPNSGIEFGETQYSDLSPEEFEENFLNLNATELMQMREAQLRNLGTKHSLDQDSELRFLQTIAPDSYDWRLQGAVSPIKNQGACGSCWAFATVATIESQFFLKYKIIEVFSEQNLIDCETISLGCSGGYLQTAFAYVQKNGLMTESAYPYEARKGSCKYRSTRVAVRVDTFNFGPSTNEEDIKSLLFSKGVLAIAINANPLQYYRKGILDLEALDCDPKTLNHAVNLVGYGDLNGFKYWIIKNSWGSKWGENGYFRIARDKGTCGVNKASVWATLK